MKHTLIGWLALSLTVILLCTAILLFRPKKETITVTRTSFTLSAEESDVSPDVFFLNSASCEQLEALPGIGEVLAARIVAYREEHGAFTSPDELILVEGIGEKTLAKIEKYLYEMKGQS